MHWRTRRKFRFKERRSKNQILDNLEILIFKLAFVSYLEFGSLCFFVIRILYLGIYPVSVYHSPVANPTSFTGLEKTTGVHFHNKNLLAQALTHRSAMHERGRHGHNERLEFLGDAVLQMITTEYLFHVSDKPEGELTNWRSALVQGNHLSQVAHELKLGEYIFMSRGEEASGGRMKDSTLADAVEAFIGATYLDQGLEVAKTFVHQFILVHLKNLLAQGKHKDEKSLLQEMAQEKTGITPTYDTIDETGPDHLKTFTCAVFIGDEQIATGAGNTKQKAEQNAAKEALKVKGWKK